MPKVKIDIMEGRTAEHKKQLLNLVHDALVESIKIPDYDRTQILNEHKPDHFERPSGKTDLYTSIEIIMFPGRSLEAKRNLYRAIARNLKTIGIDENDIMVILIEPAMENWGIQGKPATDMDLGFKIDV